MPLLSLSAATFIVTITERISSPTNRKKAIAVVIILIILVNLYILFPILTSKSAFFQMRSYAQNNIQEQDIIVADARIYRGRIAWMFNDMAYIEASQFDKLLQLNGNFSGIQRATNVYFVECVYQDDCGWGTINGQPELNASMEYLTGLFKNASQGEVVLYGGGGYGEEPDEPYFRIYKTTINLSPKIIPAIYETHDWFYYPVRWAKSDWYDKYTPQGAFQVILHLSGKIMLWIAVLAAFIISILVIRAFFQSVSLSQKHASLQ